MRSMDDVRGAVRESGEKLGRAVRALTIRLCDPTAGEQSSGSKRTRDKSASLQKDASAAAATALRYLIRHGLNQPCAEATGLCLSTLVEVIGIVRPQILEPILPDLLRSLLLAMSSLEPAALNFLQLRTNDQENLERIRLQMSQSGPLASAVNKLLEMIPKLGANTQHAVVPELDSSLRMSAGFATRAAVADCVTNLCSTSPNGFSFPGTSSGNPSVRLLRALYFASEHERGPAAREKMVHALGGLAALCPPSSVRSLAIRAAERYNRSTGNNEDPASRRSAAAAIRTISIRAAHHFADGKSAEVFARKILPVAFLGRKDSDAKIAALWEEVWNEGKSFSIDPGDSGESYGTRLEEIILPYLVGACVEALEDVSWARRVAGANALCELSDLGVLAPVPHSIEQRSNDSLSFMKRAVYRARESSAALHSCVEQLRRPRLWTGKSNVMKAAAAIASKWLKAETDLDKSETNLYGWDQVSGVCPWKPVVAASDFTGDLFLGDGWFPANERSAKDSDSARDSDSPPVTLGMRNNCEENGETINFGDCDTLLADQPEGKGFSVFSEDAITDGKSPLDGKLPLTLHGLSTFVLRQAMQTSEAISDEYIPYKIASFKGLRTILQNISSPFLRCKLYPILSPELLLLVRHAPDAKNESGRLPVAVAGALDCLSACFWEGIGSNKEVVSIDVAKLVSTLLACGTKEAAWSVREASTLCLAELANRLDSENLRQHKVISDMISSTRNACKDRKFWRVRLAGIKILDALVLRTGLRSERTDSETQLALESILPFKEELSALLRAGLQDSEAQVTSLSTEVLTRISSWP